MIIKYNENTGAATVALDNSAGSGEFNSWAVTVAGTFPLGISRGDMQYWDGSKWIRIAVGKAGDVLTLVGKNPVPVWQWKPIEQMMDIPGGLRDSVGGYHYQYIYGWWWSATERDAVYAYTYDLNHSTVHMRRGETNKRWGLSVRLVRDLNSIFYLNI